MSNKTQKIQKVQKKFFTKVMLMSFYFLIICYSQCGYAVIEEHLISGTDGLYKLCAENVIYSGVPIDSKSATKVYTYLEDGRLCEGYYTYKKFPFNELGVPIDSMELATEVATYLKNGRLSEVYIRLPVLTEYDMSIQQQEYNKSIRQLILSALTEALRKNAALKILYLQQSEKEYDRYQSPGVLDEEESRAFSELSICYLQENHSSYEVAIKRIEEVTKSRYLSRQFFFTDNHIGDEGAIALAEGLRINTTLKTLYLQHNEIGDAGARALAEALPNNTALTTLNLGRNQIGAEGAIALAEALQNNKILKTLDLGKNQIGSAGARALAEALQKNKTLTTLDLGKNQIGSAGARALAEALRNNTALTKLNLGRNQIGAEGARALTEALQNNTTLTTLDLHQNQIGDEGAGALAEALRNNKALTTLDLTNNQIGDAGARALAEALRSNTALTTLNLYGNPIGLGGAKALAEALRINTALTMLNLQYNQIGAEGASAISAALTDNYTVLDINDDGYDNGYVNKKPLLRNNLLIKLLRKIKRASSFAFAIGFHHTTLRNLSQAILAGAGLNVRNRTAFENIRNYNNEGIRDIIFKGNLEEVIRLFYYGKDAAYAEILKEVNQIRLLQREILQENHLVIPEGLVELPEELPVDAVLNMTQEERGQQRRDFVATTFLIF